MLTVPTTPLRSRSLESTFNDHHRFSGDRGLESLERKNLGNLFSGFLCFYEKCLYHCLRCGRRIKDFCDLAKAESKKQIAQMPSILSDYFFMVTPLKNPLENKPTVLRVCRSLGIEFTPEQHGSVCAIIYKTYVEVSGEEPRNVKEIKPSGLKKKVKLYPAEFIPVMINIIKDCHKKLSG